MTLSLAFDLNFINLALIFLWTFFTSLGLPGALVLMVSYGAVADNLSELFLIISAGAIAAILGDITAYVIARKFSNPLSIRLKKYKFFRDNEIKAREKLKEYEFTFVFLTRFALTQLCAVVSYVSGFEKLNRKKFIFAVISGEIIYASIYPIFGYVFKETWNDLVGVLNNLLVVFILVIIIIFFIGKNIRKK